VENEEIRIGTQGSALRKASPVLNMWANKRKLDKEKSKTCILTQQNGFRPGFSPRMLMLVKGSRA
jgi:hypothetical protein